MSTTADTLLRIQAGPFALAARLEYDRAPKTCRFFLDWLPRDGHLLHSRWSGEATWVPLGDLDLELDVENGMTHAVPGQVLFYPGPVSEAEILMPYGGSHFGSIAGELAGSHFLTIVDGVEYLRELGRLTLWEGAQPIRFERLDDPA